MRILLHLSLRKVVILFDNNNELLQLSLSVIFCVSCGTYSYKRFQFLQSDALELYTNIRIQPNTHTHTHITEKRCLASFCRRSRRSCNWKYLETSKIRTRIINPLKEPLLTLATAKKLFILHKDRRFRLSRFFCYFSWFFVGQFFAPSVENSKTLMHT